MHYILQLFKTNAVFVLLTTVLTACNNNGVDTKNTTDAPSYKVMNYKEGYDYKYTEGRILTPNMNSRYINANASIYDGLTIDITAPSQGK